MSTPAPSAARFLASPEAILLVAECEAVLQGRYAEWLQRVGGDVPPWAWLNLLVHGSEEDLRQIAQSVAEPNVWHQARRYLACELLDATEAPGSVRLEELQRQLLLPIELEAMRAGWTASWTPRGVVIGVLQAVAGYVRRRQR